MVIHDLVNDHVRVERKAVGAVGGGNIGVKPSARAFGKPAAVRILDDRRVDHRVAVGRVQEQLALVGGQKSQCVRVANHVSAAADLLGAEHVLPRHAGTRDRIAGQRYAAGSGIDQFHPEVGRQRGHDLVERNAARRVDHVGGARRAVYVRAPAPVVRRRSGRAGIDLGKRNARTVGRRGPVAAVAVGDCVHGTPDVVAEAQLLAVVGETALERAVRVRAAGLGLEFRRGNRHDHEPACRDDRPVGKIVVDPASQRPTRDVHVVAELIVELDVLQPGLVCCRVIHDLVKHHHAVGGDRVDSTQQQECGE